MCIFGQRVYAGSNIWNMHEHKSRGYIEEIIKKGDIEFYIAEKTSKEARYFTGIASDASLERLISVTDSWLIDVSNALFNDYEKQLETKDERIAKLEKNLQEKISQIRDKNLRIRGLESQMREMRRIQRSIPMQLVKRYQRVIDKLLRPGTRCRHYYELGLTGIRAILNEGWKSFFITARNRFSHSQSAK